MQAQETRLVWLRLFVPEDSREGFGLRRCRASEARLHSDFVRRRPRAHSQQDEWSDHEYDRHGLDPPLPSVRAWVAMGVPAMRCCPKEPLESVHRQSCPNAPTARES